MEKKAPFLVRSKSNTNADHGDSKPVERKLDPVCLHGGPRFAVRRSRGPTAPRSSLIPKKLICRGRGVLRMGTSRRSWLQTYCGIPLKHS